MIFKLKLLITKIYKNFILFLLTEIKKNFQKSRDYKSFSIIFFSIVITEIKN
jgi:hypothetical protein